MRSGFLKFFCVALIASAVPASAETSAPLDIDFTQPPPGYQAPDCSRDHGTTYFPFKYVMLDEHGKAEIRYVVDTDGHVWNAELELSSGYPDLDKAGVEYVSHFHCTPATLNGKPVAVHAFYELDWYVRKIKPPPADSTPGITPPVALSDHAVTEHDYPPLALANEEQGSTHIYYVVGQDGSVSETLVNKSSGFLDLDGAAVKMVQNWRFKPALYHGAPITVSNHVAIEWSLKDVHPQSAGYYDVVHMTGADYPASARAAHEEGEAIVTVTLNAQGQVLSSEIKKGTGFADLDAATADMVKSRWRFAPAAFMDRPAASTVHLVVIWSLKERAENSPSPKD